MTSASIFKCVLWTSFVPFVPALMGHHKTGDNNKVRDADDSSNEDADIKSEDLYFVHKFTLSTGACSSILLINMWKNG